MSAAKDQQVLPQREQSLFKSVLKHYESKAYKKALAAADEILERYPHNGETLAMKGLVLSSMPDCKDAKKKEALDLIKEGVRYNLASCTTWHVLGLYHRADKNYPEAVKCYKSALRYDKENQQIMRDLSYMQIHSQDYEGFFDTRKKLLLGKGQPANFVGMAVAAHLLNGAAPALAVIDGYLSEQPKPKNPDPEHSEVLMYRLSLAEDITAHEPEATRPASYAKLLKWLNENEGQIMDKMALREKRARLLLLSGDRNAAAQSYRELLELNPENKAYYIALQEAALGAQPTIADVLALYSDLEKRHPKSNLCRLMRLRALPAGSEFAAALDAFVQRYVRKGVPSLFQLLRWVYDEPARASALGEIAEKHVKALEAEGVFAGAAAEEPLEPPTTLLWALHLLAQHLAHVGQCCRALEVIDRAIKHTPTAVDLYVCRGRILKKAGDLQGAADAVEKARSMDQADRFLNTLSTRYHLRAGRTELGLATISPFAKDAPDVLTGLADMQCAWFENELARCRLSRGEPGAALHALAATAKHYADYRDDMFDFHYYGPFRRGTLRDYLATLRATSELDRHPFRVRAAVTAARAWLAFCDAPAAAVEAAKLPAVVPLASAMPPAPAEDKKEKQKKVKQAKESGEAPAKPADADPNGLKLLESARADPLREAAAALAPLLAAASSPVP